MSEENPSGDFGQMLESLPDDLKSNEFVMSHKDFGSMAKSLAHNHAMSGRKGLIVPKEGDPSNVWSDYRKGLGIPSSVDGYGADAISGVYSDDVVAGFRQTAVDAGLPASAWEKFAPSIAGAELARRDAGRQANQANMDSLKAEWSGDFDAKFDMASRAAEKLYGDSAAEIANTRLEDGSTVGTNPAWLKSLAEIGELMGEGTLGAEGDPAGGLSPDEVQQRINALWADPEKLEAMRNERHPQHAEVLAEKKKLHELQVNGK